MAIGFEAVFVVVLSVSLAMLTYFIRPLTLW